MFEKAFAVLGSSEVDPWIEGRIHSLHASVLSRLGDVKQARRSLCLASSFMKEAGDHLERLRCAIKRSDIWFSMAKDSTPQLTACITALDLGYPFESDLHECAHMACRSDKAPRAVIEIDLDRLLEAAEWEHPNQVLDSGEAAFLGLLEAAQGRLEGARGERRHRIQEAITKLERAVRISAKARRKKERTRRQS